MKYWFCKNNKVFLMYDAIYLLSGLILLSNHYSFSKNDSCRQILVYHEKRYEHIKTNFFTEFEHLLRPPFIVNKRISPVNICYHLCIVHLVDNLLLLLVVKRLRGHCINNFLDYHSRVTHLHHHVSQLFGQALRPVL